MATTGLPQQIASATMIPYGSFFEGMTVILLFDKWFARSAGLNFPRREVPFIILIFNFSNSFSSPPAISKAISVSCWKASKSNSRPFLGTKRVAVKMLLFLFSVKS